MENISNVEKANELAKCDCQKHYKGFSVCNTYKFQGKNYCALKVIAMQAMEWKDEQHNKEKESFFKEYRKEIFDACIYDFEQKKQQWIEKAVDFISKRFYIGINNHVISKEEYYTLTELIRDIEQAMKGV